MQARLKKKGWYAKAIELDVRCVGRLLKFEEPECTAMKLFVEVTVSKLPVEQLEVSIVHVDKDLLIYINLENKKNKELIKYLTECDDEGVIYLYKSNPKKDDVRASVDYVRLYLTRYIDNDDTKRKEVVKALQTYETRTSRLIELARGDNNPDPIP